MSSIIRAPKPLKKKSFFFLDEKYNLSCPKFSYDSEKIISSRRDQVEAPFKKSNLEISANPFKLANGKGKASSKLSAFSYKNTYDPFCGEEAPLENKISYEMHNFDLVQEDFETFQEEFRKEQKDKEAKEELFSILSTEHTDSEIADRVNLRGSMPPLRPANPFLKNFSKFEEIKYPIESKNMKTSSFHVKVNFEKNLKNTEVKFFKNGRLFGEREDNS